MEGSDLMLLLLIAGVDDSELSLGLTKEEKAMDLSLHSTILVYICTRVQSQIGSFGSDLETVVLWVGILVANQETDRSWDTE